MPFRIHRSLLVALLLLILHSHSRAADNLPRTWTNNLGVKREATFVRVEGDQVTLLLGSGQLVTMPLDKFSLADQEYISNLQAAPAPAAGSTQATDTQPAALTRGKSILLRPALIHAPDPRVQPKAEIYVPFPDLGKSRTDEPMGMRIRIPASYRPDRPVPLLLWLPGGDGNSRFNNAAALVNQEDFVLAGMTYPGGNIPAPNAAAVAGHINQVWQYEEKMIAKLQDMIPNTDPRMRVVVGFSNGAHIIGGCLAQQQEGLYGYFNVYVLIEGGVSDKYNYPSLPGRYYYLAWGDAEGGRGNDFGAMLAGYAKKALMKVEAHPMPGIGHDFPDAEKAKVKSWLENVVIPAQLQNP